MKQLYYKLRSLFRRFYLHLGVVLTLGIREAKDKEEHSLEQTRQKGKSHEERY